nr:hypothetical protein [uncultured Desulfobacter sp.]
MGDFILTMGLTQFKHTVFNGFVSGKQTQASLCVECGECLEHCPLHIEIPERLREVVYYCETEGIGEIVNQFMAGDQSHSSYPHLKAS